MGYHREIQFNSTSSMLSALPEQIWIKLNSQEDGFLMKVVEQLILKNTAAYTREDIHSISAVARGIELAPTTGYM